MYNVGDNHSLLTVNGRTRKWNSNREIANVYTVGSFPFNSALVVGIKDLAKVLDKMTSDKALSLKVLKELGVEMELVTYAHDTRDGKPKRRAEYKNVKPIKR